MSERFARTRWQAIILFLVLFASFAYFYQAGGWNQNSRFALVRAITGRWTLQIDGFEGCTGDRALYKGHFYSDKAPGVAFLSVPFVAAGRAGCRLAGVDPESETGIAALSYVATVATCGLAAAAAGVGLFFLVLRLGGSPASGALVALAFGLGTPMWAYATVFYGHALSTAGLFLAFMAAHALGDSDDVRPDAWLGAAVGLGAGWATVTEFPSAVPAAILACYALVRAWRHGRQRLVVTAGALAVTALACAAALGIYHWVCFDSPTHVAYTSEENFEEMKQGTFGMSKPSLNTLREVLVGSYRGILPLAPILALTPFGLMWMLRRRDTRGVAIVSLAMVSFYLLLNSSYHYWEGGWSYGPRHVSPALAFACLGLMPLWMRGGRAGRALLVVLAVASMAITLVGVSTTAQPPGNLDHPMRDLFWPSFTAGRLSVNSQGFDQLRTTVEDIMANRNPAAWNIGQRWFGLHGKVSLVPLALIWIAGAVGWAAVERRKSV